MKTAAVVLLVVASAAQAQFKCVDAQGKTTFQQTACPAAQKQQVLKVHAAPPDAPPPAAANAPVKSVDERIWDTMQRDRKTQELELSIANLENGIHSRNDVMSGEMAAIRGRKAYAKNNLAGATWEQSLSMEMQAVASKYKAMNDSDFERLKTLRGVLEATRKNGAR